ncbi:capsid cement protein [Sphingomonas sp.]|uniref:capsid cement protein n=1 Tax=Sphingomonas sp. TaxID=28214 RepID=UPI003561838B
MSSSQARISNVPRRHEKPVKDQQLVPGVLSYPAVANVELEAFRAVRVVTNTADIPLVGYANATRCVGLTTAKIALGQRFSVAFSGVVSNDAWAWTVDADVYLNGTNGGLTTTPGTIKVGKTLTPTSILLVCV